MDGLERHLNEWHARARLAAARGAFRALPQLSGSALEIASAEFAPGPSPHFFSPGVRQIAPALNDDLLDLYGRAEQVLGNRFAFFNSPQAFDNGIDWEPPQSPSWRAEIHAGDYVLDLACTLRISREEVYARQLRYLIAHWIACNPPIRGSGWQPHVVARRLRNWMLAADLARSDWERDAEFSDLVMKSVALQLTFLLSHLDSLPSPTARLDASRALLCASRYFTGNKAQEVGQRGFDLLASELAIARPEPWPHARLARAQALMEWNLWSPFGRDSNPLVNALRAALNDLEAVLTADGCLPLLGPQAQLDQDELTDLAALAAVQCGSPKWKSLAGQFGILPYLYLGEAGKAQFESLDEVKWAPQDYAETGAEILRLVGPGESALAISAHVPASRDEHQDFSSYELSLHGHRLVVDSGGFGPDSREYFPQARAHNLLMIDGHAPRWDGSADPPGAAYDLGDGGARLRISDPGFAFLGIKHERAWFRLKNNVWLILDRLEGEGIHRCTSLLHFYPTYEIIANGDRFLAKSRACNFAVIPVGSAKPVASISRGDHPQFPGWYSPEFGVKFPAAVLALEWTGMELPWVGGVLIVAGAEEHVRQVKIIPTDGYLRLEFSGRPYDLRMK